MSTPRQDAIIGYVRTHPGCTILSAALSTKPSYRSQHMSGYAAAHRALRRGALVNRGSSTRYKLFVPATDG